MYDQQAEFEESRGTGCGAAALALLLFWGLVAAIIYNCCR